MRDSASVSAFAARRTAAPTEKLFVSDEFAPTRDSSELLEQPSSIEYEELSSPSASENENQFAVLNRSIIGPSIGLKRIFELGENTVRVELSGNRSIAILGVFNVWVKHGEIAVLGARLPASPTLQRIYAPATIAIPQITACSENAVFVLTSDGGDLLDLYTGTQRSIWDAPGRKTLTERSFHILGYSFAYDRSLRKRLRLLDLTRWRSIMAAITKQLPEGRKVLVCGSGSTGKSTFCRAFINRSLADQAFDRDNSPPKSGVLLLDLDLTQPEMTPCGLIYLAHIRTALFGPPESHFAIAGSMQNRVLRMHYLGGVHADNVYDAGTNAIKDLIQYCNTVRQDYPGCPVLINSSSWLFDMESTQLSNLVSMMRLSDIIYFDSSGSLKYQEVLTRSMGERCNLWGLASKVYRSAPSSIIQWSYLQSYFHLVHSESPESTWDQFALLSSNKKKVHYSGPKSMCWAIITFGERLELGYVAQALEDSVVAIIAIEIDGNLRTQADDLLEQAPRPLLSNVGLTIQDIPDEQQAEDMHIKRTEVENLPYFQDFDLDADLLHPQRSECLGLAYVTAIDPVRETIELLTPISQQNMSNRKDNGFRLAMVMARQHRQWAPTYG